MGHATRDRTLTAWLIGPALSWLCVFGFTAALAAAQQPGPEPANTQPETQPETQPATQPAEAPAPAISETAATEITEESIQARTSQIQAASDLSETVRNEVLGLYRQALDQISVARNWARKAEEFRAGRERAPQDLQAARDALAAASTRPAATQPIADRAAGMSLEELNQRVSAVEAELRAARELVTQLQAEADARADRRKVMPDLIGSATQRRAAATEALSSPAPPDAPPQLTLGRRTLQLAIKRATEQEIAAYEEELRFYEARSPVLAARRERARLKQADAQARVQTWQTILTQRRAADAERQKEQAEAELRRTPQAIRDLARQNKELADELLSVNEKLPGVQERLAASETTRNQFDRKHAELRDALELAATAGTIGPSLRRMRMDLRAMSTYERDLQLDMQNLAAATNRGREVEEQRLELADISAAVDERMAELRGVVAATQLDGLRPVIEDRLTTRRETLRQLDQAYETYEEELRKLVINERRLLQKATEFKQFIDEHVLWIPSTTALRPADFELDWHAFAERWVTLGRWLAQGAKQRPVAYGLALLLFAVLVFSAARWRRRLREIRERVTRYYTDSYVLTVEAVLHSALLALPGPLLLFMAALLVRRAADLSDPAGYDFAVAASGGLIWAGSRWLMLNIVRQGCRPGGLAEAHFRWDAAGLKVVRRNLVWYTAIVVPAIFVIATLEQFTEDAWRNSLSRLVFVVTMLAQAAFVHRLLKPSNGAFAGWYRRHPESWIYKLRYAWYVAGVVLPLVFAAASLSGYHYTALQLVSRLMHTLWLVLALALVYAMAERGVLVAQRNLAIDQARKKRQASAQAGVRERRDDDAVDPAPAMEEAALDLVSIGAQTRRLLQAGAALALAIVLWVTWADVLPALSFINEVELWKYGGTETVAVAGGDGAAGEGEGPAAEVTDVAAITLGHVVLALVVGFVTFLLARNIPGLLEITVLQWLPMDAGGRFAATAIARYAIVTLGVIVAFSWLGVGWSKVQWLVAAVSVGLGFGLQEIFANFVSGIMVLFERPIRIGDTVTVANTSGTVTRIRIRATTITDWDRKELIIPNKEFITGQIINWTLSDPVLRVTIPVGIAYGSDVDLAEKKLEEVAAEEPLVLADPRARILFVGFGDSSLNFELRVYIPSVDYLLLTRHRLLKAIDRKFREASIEIAFPQRDLHIRTFRPALRMTRERYQGRPVVADDPDGAEGTSASEPDA